MEDWIGILLVLLMIPGLLLLIGVVVMAMLHLKGNSEPITPPVEATPIDIPPARTDA